MGDVLALLDCFRETLERQRKRPGDSLVSVVLETRVNGESLSEPELLMFCVALLVAGNETTRTLLSNGMLALAENPDQCALLAGDHYVAERASAGDSGACCKEATARSVLKKRAR